MIHTTRKENIITINTHSVNNGIMALKVLHESALWTFPLLNAATAARCKGEFGGMDGQGSDALFVVGENTHGLSGCQIP